MDLGADGNASTLRASVTSAGDRGLTLRGLLSLLGITDPPIAAPDGVACDPLLDVVIDAVDASFDVSGGSLALVEFTATVRSTGTYQLIGVPAVRLTGIGASVHWTPTSVSGVMIGQLAVGPVLVTVAYDGDVFAGWAEAGASGRPDFAALLASPPFDPGFGLPGGAPASIPLDRVEATARPGDFLEIRGGGDVAWAFTVAGLETTVTGLGGRIRIEAGRAGRAATYDCALLGTLALASVNGSAVAVFGSDRDTVLTAAVTAGEGVSFSALAGSLTGGDPDSSWNALVPPGDGTAALGRASQAFVYLNLTKGRIAVAGKLERFGHAALISFEPDAGRGYAFVGGLGDGFQFVNLWSALGAVDEVLAVRKADACVMSLTATAGSIEADLALVRDAAAVQHITSFSIALPPTVDPQAPLPRGMSLLAVLDLTAGTLTRNVGTLVGDATIVLSALVDHDDPARTFYTMRIEQADLVGGGLTLDGTATYRPGGEDPRLEVDGALTLNLGSKHYAFGGTFTIAADRAEFSAGPGRPVSIGEPLGMSGITLTDAQLTARYGFGRDASPAVVQVTGVVNLDPLELTGLVLFAGGAAQVVSIGLTGQLSIATFMTSVLHLPWPAGFDPVQLENGTISYADAAPGSFVRAGNVEYPGGYHITAMVSLLGATLGVDVLVDPAVGVRVSGSCQGTVDLYLAQIADPVLRIDTTQPATVYAAEFGITMFGTPFARITLAFEPHEDPGQRRYVGTATYPGMLLGTENPAVKLSYTKAGGLRLEEWPVLADVTQYLDLARELYQATSSDDPCGALVDLVFSQALTTKVSLGLKQDTSAATSESLPVVVTGTWAVLAGEEQLFELKLPDLHGVILVPAGLSADDLLTWIGGMIKANGAEIVKTVLGDPAMLTLLAKELVVDDLSSDVVKALLCHGADTIPLLDRALRDALRPPQPPPDQPPKPPPGGPTPIGDIAMDAAVAGTIASGLMAVILAIGSLFSAEARRRKKEAEGERGRQLKIKAEKEAQLRAALKLRGHPTLAFQGDGSLVVTWTEDNRPAEPGFDYQGYRGVGYEVDVTDEAGGTHAFTAEGWSVTVPAATLAQSPVATVTMRAWFAGQAGEFTSPVSARHVATLPAPASVTGTYNPATDAIDVTVAAVTHANSYLIEVWADREILATASPAQGPGDATAAFAVTDLPAGLPGDTTLQARARAVGDGTTWADSPVTAAAQALPVESGPVPSIALNEAGDEAVVAWSGRQPSQVAPIRFLDGDGTVISLPVSPGQAGMVADLSGLADGTVVNVELRAPAGHVIAPWSAPASVVVHRLATPRELDALYQTPEAQIVLTWQPVGGAAGYDAELTDGDGAPVPATITIDRSQPGATISGPAIVTGPAYGVRVRAAGGFASLWTGVHPVTAEAVPAVTQVTVEVAQGTVTATWAADGATRFLVTLSQGQAQLTRQWADSPEASWRLDAGLHLEGDRPFAVTVRPRVRQALGPPASGQGSFAGLLTLVQGLRAAGRSAADAAGVAVTAFPAIGPVQLLTALAAAGYPAGESRAATAASLPDVPPATLNETVAALQAPKPLYDLLIREVDPASIKPLFEVLFAGPLVLMAVAYKKAGLTGPQALPLLGGPVAQVVVTAVYDDPEQLGAALRTGQVAAQAAVAAFRDAYPDLGLGPIVASLQGGWYSVLDPLLGRALMACYPVGTAAYADVIAPGLSPAQLVQALVAVAEPYQALDQLLRVRSGITLAAAGEALASGLDNAGAKVPALSLQQIFGRGVSEALSRDPGGVNPPPPGTTGGPAGWSRPLFDPAPQAPVLALCAAPGGEPVLVANTGAYLTFLDAATSEIRAVVEGDTWDMRVAARGDVVYACDVLAGQFHALRADGSLAWQQPFAGGQWVVAETVVVFQDTATGALAAFDRLTGAPRWAASPGVAVPNLGMAAAEGMIFFKTGAGKGNAGLQAWDERTGTLIWSRSDLGHGDGLWIPLTGLDVVDYDLVCTVAPYVWFLDPATGQRLRSGQPFVDWSQRPGRYSWAATPFPYLAFMGALGGVGWLMSPATASIPTRAFPSLGTARNGRPDYNDWKVPVPFTIGAHFYLSLPGPDLVRVIQIAPPSDPLEVHGTEIRTLTGAATDIVVDSGTYYATMIQPGRRGLDGVWLVCLPIDVSAPPPPPPAVGTAILVRRDFSDCGNSDVTAARGAEHGGTVTVLRQPSSFSATVTLDHGTPDTSYHFFLKCVAYLGNVVTDASGRGTATFEFASSLVGSRIAFDMYPPGAPRGNKFLSTPLTI
jgi:hypothetical protein